MLWYTLAMTTASEVRLRTAFRQRPVMTLEEIRQVLGGKSKSTALAALRALGYRTSYNHNSRYYTLAGTCSFDQWGLWSHKGVRFSREGKLTATVGRLVAEAEAGWTRRELEELLGTKIQPVLTTLRKKGEIAREKIGPVYVYVAPETAAAQLEARRERLAAVQQRSEVPLEVVVAVLLVLVRHPGSDPGKVVWHLKVPIPLKLNSRSGEDERAGGRSVSDARRAGFLSSRCSSWGVC